MPPLTSRHALSACALALTLLVTGCGRGEEAGLERVRKALATRDAAAARVELKSFLQKHPTSAEGRLLLGRHLEQGADFSDAVAEYQRALDNGMARERVLPAMARAMVRAGDLGRVVSMFREETLPDAQAQAGLGASVALALAARGDLRAATEVIDRALANAPGSAPARLVKARLEAAAGRVDAGLKMIDAVLAEHPRDADAWTTKGDFMLKLPGRRADAAQAYEEALKIAPQDVHALDAVVPVHLALGDLAAARRAVDRLRAVAPRHFATGRAEAALAYAVGDHARARELYQELLKAAPDQVPLLLQAGENEMLLGALAQAEALFAKASALQPANPVARRLLGKAQLRLGQVPKAIQTLTPLAEAPDAGAEVLALAAEARQRHGDAAAADALFARLAKLQPEDPRLQTIVAMTGFGRTSDEAVFEALRRIASRDKGSTADMALIQAHMQRGQSDAALKALAALDAKLPAEPSRHVLRGQILAGKQDWAGARQAFEAALAMAAQDLPAITALAALDARENKPEAAQQRFRQLLKAQPGNARAMLGLAEVIERQKRDDADVLKLRRAAVKAAPGDPDAQITLIQHHLQRRENEAALTAAQAATTAVPDNIDLLELLGRCEVASQRTSQALASFGKIITLAPRSPRGHVLTAALQAQLGELEAARRSVEKALQAAPDHAESLGLAVNLAIRQRHADQARTIARQAQQLKPDDALGWALEGEVAFAQRDWALAEAAYRKAVDKPNAGAAARRLYATLLHAGKPTDAAAFSQQWLKAHPRDVDFVQLQGDFAQARGDLAAAANHYERALEIAPAHALTLNNLAMLRLQTRQPGALPLAQRAAAAAPDEPAVLDTLAQALAASGEVDDAIETQSRAVRLAPATAELRLSLARLLLQAGEKARAKTELQRLSELGTSFRHHDDVQQLLRSLGRN